MFISSLPGKTFCAGWTQTALTLVKNMSPHTWKGVLRRLDADSSHSGQNHVSTYHNFSKQETVQHT